MKKNKFIICLIIFFIVVFFVLVFAIYNLINNFNNDIKINTNKNDNENIDNSIVMYNMENAIKNESISKYNNPLVPKGFEKVETKTASWELDENGNPKGWNNGLVIEDEIGNQFVWIPVKSISTFEKKDGYYGGSIQNILQNCTEADYINQTIESKELYESIAKYSGFYIARYEAGFDSNGYSSIQDGSQQPLSKKGVITWTNIRWGSEYNYALDGIQGSDIENGAVKVARSMYPNLKYIKEYNLPKSLTNNTDVISTLCYGVQWDLVMEFMKDVENPYANTEYIKDSTKMGYFAVESHNELQTPGKDIDEKSSNCVKNIYDMAGNVWEWTMESYKNHYRVYRGGMYEMGDEKPSASMRAYSIPDGFGSNRYIGFRVALYIK